MKPKPFAMLIKESRFKTQVSLADYLKKKGAPVGQPTISQMSRGNDTYPNARRAVCRALWPRECRSKKTLDRMDLYLMQCIGLSLELNIARRRSRGPKN